MPLNVGYIELGGSGVVVRVYYDATATPVGDDQPLVNGPRGLCLDVSNATGMSRRLTVSGVKSNPLLKTIQVLAGDPVTTGPARSRTLTEMQAAGYTTRGSVGMLALE